MLTPLPDTMRAEQRPSCEHPTMSSGSAVARGYRRVVHRAHGPLEPARARARMSAYVYGTLLALAAVVVVDPPAIEDGTAVLVVVGTTATTFLAHVFAEIVAHRVMVDTDDDRPHPVQARAALEELRDALPIASSGAFPAAILALGWLEVLSPTWAYILAGAGPIARIAVAEVAIQRLQNRPMTVQLLVGALITAAVATAIVAIKVAVAH
ncbi:hypothetical protein GCM10009722_30270 [Williamsia deligens]